MNIIRAIKRLYSNSDHLDFYCLIFCYLFVFLFPIFVTSKFYFTLSIAKFSLFIILTSLLTIFVVVNLIFTKKFKFKKPTLNLTDIAFIVFLSGSVLATVFSSYFSDCLLGVSGRFNGLLTIALYFIIYIIITRFSTLRLYIIELLTISSTVVFLLGILNGYGIRLFGETDMIIERQKGLFISTIGNRNFYCTFITITLSIIFIKFIKAHKNKEKVFYGIATAIGSIAMGAATSDSGYSAFFVFFWVAPLFVFDSRKGLARYFITALIFITGQSLYYATAIKLKVPYLATTAISNIFTNYLTYIFIVVIALIITCAYKLPSIEKYLSIIKYVIFSLFGSILIIIITFAVIYSTTNIGIDIGGFNKYFKFSNEWGDYRGSVWFYLFMAFINLPFYKMLIGIGPDTIYLFLQEKYTNAINVGDLKQFDSAHNEYLQYLVTTGIIGGVAFLALIVFSIYYGAKYYKKSPIILPLTMSVLLYATQAVFNISMISTAPLFIVILSLLMADVRRIKLTE